MLMHGVKVVHVNLRWGICCQCWCWGSGIALFLSLAPLCHLLHWHPLTSWLVLKQALYEKFEAEGRARDQIDARKLWFAIMDAQVCGDIHGPWGSPHLSCLLQLEGRQPSACLHCARSDQLEH
jgi:hypothetical protein